MAESWPFVYVVDFWHWLQFEWFEFFTRRNIKYALAVANSNRIGIEHVSNRREKEKGKENNEIKNQIHQKIESEGIFLNRKSKSAQHWMKKMRIWQI